MDKVKIIHCADIHLDTPFKGLDIDLREELKNDIKTVLKNIINKCNEEKTDILLIAGDVFDNYSIKRETLNFMQEIFKMLEKTKVFISPGNHDPINEKSFYNIVNWPENVYIFSKDMEYVEDEELKVRIYGCGFSEKYVYKSMLENIEPREDYINILVLHGDLEKNTSEYNPISKEQIKNSRLDYIALGHIHNFSGVEKEGKTYYSYSGCPQGRGFDELGDKGIVIGNLYKGYADLNFENMALKKYYEKRIDISKVGEGFEIKNKILEEVEPKKTSLVKIILTGSRNDKTIINTEWLEESLKDKFYFIKILDETKLKIEDIEKLDYIRRDFINAIDEKRRGEKEEEEILNLALELGLKYLEGEEVNLDDN